MPIKHEDVADIIFLDSVSSVTSGSVFPIGRFTTVTLEITGTSTSRTINFEGSSVSGTFYQIQGTKLSDLTLASQTSGTGELWQFTVTGLVSFRTNLTAVAGGTVTVKGKGVAE